MNKKVVVLGGGTGLSTLLRGLKQFPFDITAIVAVSDDGKSTGRLREEFSTPAVGDLRQVIVALSETEPLFQKLMNYRFDTYSDLDGHALGNLLITGVSDVAGGMAKGIESLSKVLNLKGKVLPLTEDETVTLIAKTTDGTIIEGEQNITESKKRKESVSYKKNPKILPEVLKEIKKADLIVLSMGSIFTSILPNLICQEMKDAIDESKAEVMYICNIMTQPGETDNFKASDHVEIINKHLGEKKIAVVLANNGKISDDLKKKYETEEQKDPVIFDSENLKNKKIQIISDDFVNIEDNTIRHNTTKMGFHIFSYLIL